jgi:hypothetical protein
MSQDTRKLPPLILHPFADPTGPDKLLESSRASLMLQGLLPSGERPAIWIGRCWPAVIRKSACCFTSVRT